MFIYDPDYSFTWPVTVRMPEAGADVEHSFTATFCLPTDETDLFERPAGETTAEMIDNARERMREVWIGWDGIEVKNGGKLPFSAGARDNLLSIRAVRVAVTEAYFAALVEVREKN